MFKFLKRPSSAEQISVVENVEPKKKHRLVASRNVSTSHHQFYFICVPHTADEATARALIAELIEMRKDCFGRTADKYPIMRRELKNETQYFFSEGSLSISGTDYNPLVYTTFDIVYADKMVSESKKTAVDFDAFEDVTEKVKGILYAVDE